MTGAVRAGAARLASGDATTRRDWDVIVVGLGALGSGAAYWLSRAPAPASWASSSSSSATSTAPRPTTAGSSACPTTGPTTSGSRGAPTRPGPRWRPRPDERIVTVTGGLDLWPADPAIPMADYTDSLAAEDVPFELLDAAEVMRRWPQWRLRDDVTGDVPGRRAASPTRRGQRRPPAARPRARRDAPRPDAGHGHPRRRRRRARGRGRRTACTDRPRSSLAADAWTNGLLAGFDRRLPLTVTKEQVTYFACPDPAAFAPDRFPVWIWMDEPSFYGFPTYGEAGPEGGPGLRRPPVDPGHPDVRARRGGVRPRPRAFLAAHLPGAVGPPILHQDLPVHAHPGPRLRASTGCPRHPGVLVGLGAAHGFKYASVLGRILAELARRRSDAVGRRARRVPDRPADPARGRTRRPHWMV